MEQALTSFGPAGAAVAIVWIFIRYFVPILNKLSEAVDKNTEVTSEMHKFLENLNGSLEKSVKAKQKK